MVHRADSVVVGSMGFKGPPDNHGVVEIGYGVVPAFQGRGYATEATEAALETALGHKDVCLVRAHTLPTPNASTRVLEKCGFERVGQVDDPEDGLVWRWEVARHHGL